MVAGRDWHAEKSKELISNGEIGDPQHIMATNYVPYGRAYWEQLYRDYSISGRLFLQKATHDLDYISYLMGKAITSISAMGSYNIFKGNEEAGLFCSKCGKTKTCIESPYNRKLMGFSDADHACLFSKDLNDQPTNEDSSSCIFEFEDGSHGLYTSVLCPSRCRRTGCTNQWLRRFHRIRLVPEQGETDETFRQVSVHLRASSRIE